MTYDFPVDMELLDMYVAYLVGKKDYSNGLDKTIPGRDQPNQLLFHMDACPMNKIIFDISRKQDIKLALPKGALHVSSEVQQLQEHQHVQVKDYSEEAAFDDHKSKLGEKMLFRHEP